jgi:two-component system, LuxR family, response regulator FixJ
MVHRRHLILIVDDDQAVRDSLQFALQLEGLSVRVHRGGTTLLADPDLSKARCLILDERNPCMDGFALLGRLQALNISLPAILLTNHATPRIKARAKSAGVRLVLEKPLMDNALADNIRLILEAGPNT